MEIAVIPARGGSKRIPGKNVKDFYGKPIISWPIKVALESGLFQRVIVSTDDYEIARIANQYGAETPFIRPAHLSDDFSTTADVMFHALKWFSDQEIDISAACCIYPTSLFFNPEDLRIAIKEMYARKSFYAFSVAKFSSNPYRGFTIDSELHLEMLFPDYYSTRTQDLKSVYFDAGQFYWGTNEAWLGKYNIYSDNSYPYILPAGKIEDIDDYDDWERAERIWALTDKEF